MILNISVQLETTLSGQLIPKDPRKQKHIGPYFYHIRHDKIHQFQRLSTSDSAKARRDYVESIYTGLFHGIGIGRQTLCPNLNLPWGTRLSILSYSLHWSKVVGEFEPNNAGKMAPPPYLWLCHPVSGVSGSRLRGSTMIKANIRP